MKTKSPPGYAWAVGVVLLSFVFTGCARGTVRMKLVDATTMRPLAGVVTEWRQDRIQLFRPFARVGPANLPPSGLDGVVVAGDYRWLWIGSLTFACPGYAKLYGEYDRGRLRLAKEIGYYLPREAEGAFYLQGAWKIAEKSGDVYVVPMEKPGRPQ